MYVAGSEVEDMHKRKLHTVPRLLVIRELLVSAFCSDSNLSQVHNVYK